MPKVTNEYTLKKRNLILECTTEILKEKPLYLITMRDIIKKAGFSQGAIYRYYANLDEIYIDLININTTDALIVEKIDSILGSSQSEKDIVFDCFIEMGKYIENLLQSAGGKLFFELLVTYAYDPEKRATIFPNLKFKQNLECVQSKIANYTISNIENSIFNPSVPIDTIAKFINTFIDGIAQTTAVNPSVDNSHDFRSASDIPDMFHTLAKAVIHFLEA